MNFPFTDVGRWGFRGWTAAPSDGRRQKLDSSLFFLAGGHQHKKIGKKTEGAHFLNGFEGENARKNREKTSTATGHREIKGLTFLVLNFMFFCGIFCVFLCFSFYRRLHTRKTSQPDKSGCIYDDKAIRAWTTSSFAKGSRHLALPTSWSMSTRKTNIIVPERFFPIFGLRATDLAIFVFKFGFCSSKSPPGRFLTQKCPRNDY